MLNLPVLSIHRWLLQNAKDKRLELTLLGWQQQKENVVQTSYFCCLQPDNNRFIKRILWYLNSWAPVCRRTYVPGEATMVKAAVEKSMNELKTSFPHLFFSQHATQVWTWQTHHKWSAFQSFFLSFFLFWGFCVNQPSTSPWGPLL